MGATTLFVYVGMLIALTVLGIYTARLSFKSKSISKQEWISNYAQGFSSGMIGAVVAGLALGLIVLAVQTNEGASTQQAELKKELIEQLGSHTNEVAVPAAEELRRHGWLFDGSLRGIVLANASLQGVNFQGADLEGANMQGANLMGANLQNANLKGANLQGANLIANMQGADLEEANLQGVDLGLNNGLSIPILPDGSYIGWKTDTTIFPDTTRFTNPNHPNFWRSSEPSSPAYSKDAPTPTLAS